MATVSKVVSFRDDNGAPETGLTPTIVTMKKVSDGSDVVAPAVSEIGGGFYLFSVTTTEALVCTVDGGAALTGANRYATELVLDTDMIDPLQAGDILTTPANTLDTTSDGNVIVQGYARN